MNSGNDCVTDARVLLRMIPQSWMVEGRLSPLYSKFELFYYCQQSRMLRQQFSEDGIPSIINLAFIQLWKWGKERREE
jgi:hypothetical protein